ncbi:pfs domain-containing protein [Fusarium oxysporum f. sp. phaseoli]
MTCRTFEGPEIHYGLMASGDRVMRSTVKRSEVIRNIDNVLRFEMEAAGLMTEFWYVVIRGISDYVDFHKNL